MITFAGITKEFLNGTYGLRDVSFHIEPGELVLVTGPSGSGKTTMMKVLTREYPQTAGDAWFDGQSLDEIKSSNVHLLRRKIGVVFQDYKLLPELNAWENIALPLSIIGKKDEEISQRVIDLLELVELTDKAELFPSELSGGEAQRISIARALAIAPKVLYADEPTGNLDPKTTKHIVSLLKKINDLGTTVMLATHDLLVMDLLEKERLLSLEDGKLVKDTKPKSMPKVKMTEEKEAEKPPAKESKQDKEPTKPEEKQADEKVEPEHKEPEKKEADAKEKHKKKH